VGRRKREKKLGVVAILKNVTGRVLVTWTRIDLKKLKQFMMPVERRYNSKGHLKMVHILLSITLGVVDAAKDTMTLRNFKVFPFLWEEVYCMICSFLCNTKLFVYKQ